MISKATLHTLILIALSVLFQCIHLKASAQEEPPRPLQVSNYQHLSFGSFVIGNTGGSISISPDGSRNTNGDIIPLFTVLQYHPAIFEVLANPGVIITIVNGPDVVLTGSNGGQMILHPGNSMPASPFINTTRPPFKTQIMIGGTITVGNALANPAGEYTGQFYITFVQQ